MPPISARAGSPYLTGAVLWAHRGGCSLLPGCQAAFPSGTKFLMHPNVTLLWITPIPLTFNLLHFLPQYLQK